MAQKPNHFIRIDKIAAQFEVWLDGTFPFAKIKVKVLERSPGDFLAVPNVNVMHLTSHEPVYVSGLGNSVDEALEDLLTRFVSDACENTPPDGLSQEDFEWAATEDY